MRLLVPVLTLFAIILFTNGSYFDLATAATAGTEGPSSPSGSPTPGPWPSSVGLSADASRKVEEVEKMARAASESHAAEIARLKLEVEQLSGALARLTAGADATGKRVSEVEAGVSAVKDEHGVAGGRMDALDRGIAAVEAEVGAVRVMAKEAAESARRIREEALEAVKEEVARSVARPAERSAAKNLALIAAGARVIASHTTAPISFSRFYLPLWTRSFLSPRENRPELALSALGEDQLTPGQCFGFQGQAGRLAFKLAWASAIKSVVVAHTRAARDVTSAPRELTVIGFPPSTSLDSEGVQLCKVEYNADGPVAQEWACTGGADGIFESVVIDIASNSGNPDFTCLYSIKLLKD